MECCKWSVARIGHTATPRNKQQTATHCTATHYSIASNVTHVWRSIHCAKRVLYSTVIYTLQHPATHCTTLHCNTLQHTIECHSCWTNRTLCQKSPIFYSNPHPATPCNTLQHPALQHIATQNPTLDDPYIVPKEPYIRRTHAWCQKSMYIYTYKYIDLHMDIRMSICKCTYVYPCIYVYTHAHKSPTSDVPIHGAKRVLQGE